jgi:hypothetical protein
MNVILDLIGAGMVALLLLLMMLSFQFQLTDTAQRAIYTSQMLTHQQMACNDLNRIIALAGIGMPEDSVVVFQALEGKLSFRTCWDFKNDSLTVTPKTIQLSLNPTATGVGKQLHIVQSGTPVFDMGYIFWLEDLKFNYYRSSNVAVAYTNTVATDIIRYVDVLMVFRRAPYTVNPVDLRTKVVLRCYLMNCYLRDGVM